jgi:hypothetical protein
MLGNSKDPEKRPCFSDGEPKVCVANEGRLERYFQDHDGRCADYSLLFCIRVLIGLDLMPRPEVVCGCGFW